MKKIIYLIFLCFLCLSCSKDESNLTESNSEVEAKKQIAALFSKYGFESEDYSIGVELNLKSKLGSKALPSTSSVKELSLDQFEQQLKYISENKISKDELKDKKALFLKKFHDRYDVKNVSVQKNGSVEQSQLNVVSNFNGPIGFVNVLSSRPLSSNVKAVTEVILPGSGFGKDFFLATNEIMLTKVDDYSCTVYADPEPGTPTSPGKLPWRISGTLPGIATAEPFNGHVSMIGNNNALNAVALSVEFLYKLKSEINVAGTAIPIGTIIRGETYFNIGEDIQQSFESVSFY